MIKMAVFKFGGFVFTETDLLLIPIVLGELGGPRSATIRSRSLQVTIPNVWAASQLITVRY
jgi:hypothetical protein